MKLHFLGANRQVTGSRYCLEAGGHKVLVDCGMFQEREFLARNWGPSPIPPTEIDALLLTHVHIDHSGLIPKLVRDGFTGPIYCTRPSVDLADVMLRDSAKIQAEDAAYKKRRHQREGRTGKYPELPLYTESDVERAMKQFRSVPYNKPIMIGDSIEVTFHDAGHILGSAMLDVRSSENGNQRRILFSGDVGQWDKPLIRDPTLFDEADYVVMESTYGDREHIDGGDIALQLANVVNATVERGGNVVIPTFAVERAQELMYYISQLVHANRIPDIKVFLDSPMAVDVTGIFLKYRDCLDQETWQLISSGQPPLHFPGLHMVSNVRESKAINEERHPCIIMATSGMCNGGRIKHHLRQNIGRSESTILFVGYQSHGTLGRQIVEGKPIVRIHGRDYKVHAHIAQLYGFSGHADRAALLRWLTHLRQPPRQVFLTHGEESAAIMLAQVIQSNVGWNVSVPDYHSSVDLE